MIHTHKYTYMQIFAPASRAITQEEWRQLVSQLHLVSRFLAEYEDRMAG